MTAGLPGAFLFSRQPPSRPVLSFSSLLLPPIPILHFRRPSFVPRMRCHGDDDFSGDCYGVPPSTLKHCGMGAHEDGIPCGGTHTTTTNTYTNDCLNCNEIRKVSVDECAMPCHVMTLVVISSL